MNRKIPRGRFVWYELLTSDTNAAQRFYTQLIGWDTASWRTGDEPYMHWMQAQQRIGGLMRLPDEATKPARRRTGWATSRRWTSMHVALATKLGASTLMPATNVRRSGASPSSRTRRAR
jgi:predicted enzyme related to lactoylglutathione lyase